MRNKLTAGMVALMALQLMVHADWQPAGDKMKTRWAKDVTVDNVLPDYPRPQIQRENWVNLNGLWDYDKLTHEKTEYHDLVPTSAKEAQRWRITEEQPADNWFSEDFDDSNWSEQAGGFGNNHVPNARVSSPWNSKNLWLRRKFQLDSVPKEALALSIYHDEDVVVYLNGKEVFKSSGFTTTYINKPFNQEQHELLREGENLLAVHVKQTIGGQFIDVGIRRMSKVDIDVTPVYGKKILVPFAVESSLSGIGEAVKANETIFYRRRFSVPNSMKGQRVLLHFGAVDWESWVFVNETLVGTHRGGHAPFHYDVTDALKDEGEQILRVEVRDPTTEGLYPIGKQSLNPMAVWYTAVSGIWGTVWLEGVPQTYVKGLHMIPRLADSSLSLHVTTDGDATGMEVHAVAMLGGKEVGSVVGAANDVLALNIPNAELWSPDSPTLYDLKVSLKKGHKTIDRVDSYFGMRECVVKKDAKGINRLFFNGKPLFQYGTLDQGWWPDGLYTAPTDEALRYDVEITKKLGFNMIRKHIKVEPLRWYTHCDQIGMLVWQDMPSAAFASAVAVRKNKEVQENFYQEWGEIIDSLINHPSIIMWVPFNESWGQFDTKGVTAFTEARDPHRLVNNASGWHDFQVGDVRDLHMYPGPTAPPLEETRAAVLGEFGGLGHGVEGRIYYGTNTWGHSDYPSLDALRAEYDGLMERLMPLVDSALAAAVYTQITDVEYEVNGLLTYDRDVLKFDLNTLQNHHKALTTRFDEDGDNQ